MNACNAAWYAERLMGAQVIIASSTTVKLMVGVSGTTTLSVLLRDAAPRATLQHAIRGAEVHETVLSDETSWAAILGRVARTAVLRGVLPPSGTPSKPASAAMPVPTVQMSPRGTLRFATEYAAHTLDVREMVVRCLQNRAAAIVAVPGGTVWVDLGTAAVTTTSTASARPARTAYPGPGAVDQSTYKWARSKGHMETVQACKAVLTEVSRIVR